MRAKDPLYRCAVLIHRTLQLRSNSSADQLTERFSHLAGHCESIARRWRRSRRALQHRWTLAAARLQADLVMEAFAARQSATELLTLQSKPTLPVPPLSMLVDELRQLQIEFEDQVQFSPKKGVISLETDPIELEGLHLGRFSMVLTLRRLCHDPSSDCFACVALEPNPAQSSESITHPHVKNESLCAGDAALPISLALQQGRIYDAFTLIHSVLQTYNSGSPYVSIEDWDGSSCPDCGGTASRDDLYFCEACQREVCGGCSGGCEICDLTACLSCLERDTVSGLDCCPNCYENCLKCGRVVDTGHADAKTQLCPQCLAEQRLGQEAEEQQIQPLPHEHLKHDPSSLPTEPSEGIAAVEAA